LRSTCVCTLVNNHRLFFNNLKSRNQQSKEISLFMRIAISMFQSSDCRKAICFGCETANVEQLDRCFFKR
jgi:hypothetical protein